ncbi:NAD(P)H-hydrate epimerase, partial [Okeania sp. SIO2B9]|uniref:NAD(P)H-hydrate epimerase n=1 Tax=Okeania sp. SIO2B9 TaxID=2607782 RepID=UPI001429D266
MNNTKEKFVVTAAQMRQIEERIFVAGMPVAALMEKVAGLVTRRIVKLFNRNISKIGILVGPGHNGGDALVIARELYFQGYEIIVYCPIPKLKELTNAHSKYLQSLGVNFVDNISPVKNCDLLIDGLFGFGLEREITGDLAVAINQINSWKKQIFSIDLPSVSLTAVLLVGLGVFAFGWGRRQMTDIADGTLAAV